MLDYRPSWRTGHATLREMEAPMESVRVVWAAGEAAANLHPPLDLVGVNKYHEQPVDWEAHVIEPDRARVEAFLHHWHNMTGKQYRLGARDAVTWKEIAGIKD